MEIDQTTADDCCDRAALHRAATERRVATLRLRTIHVKHPFKLRIENRYVRMRTLSQGAAFRETEDSRGVGRAHLHHAFEIDQSLVHEIERESDRGFESGDSERRLVKFQRLFIG